jgi:lipoprotein-anchoring transpeptidase ErfK/SrfK
VTGTVTSVLAIAVAAAVLGGMFTPTGHPAVASPMRQSMPDTVTPKLPGHSGHGRRVVFDQSEQRVWLVKADGTVARSYLVTGSSRGNVWPGSYKVRSKTRYARTYRGGGTLEYFVKFTQGRTAAIGFHAVTVRNNGTLVYARQDLGKARTPGCVEAMREDAAALWDFAPVGTPVEVTA